VSEFQAKAHAWFSRPMPASYLARAQAMLSASSPESLEAKAATLTLALLDDERFTPDEQEAIGLLALALAESMRVNRGLVEELNAVRAAKGAA
jgi:hypothetical protein